MEESNLKYLIGVFTVMILTLSQAQAAKRYEFNVLAGLDRPTTTSTERKTSAGLLRFSLSGKVQFFRIVNSATFAFGGGNYLQGEYAIGPYLYLLAAIIKDVPAQPFLGVEGVVGFGKAADKTRIDAGYALGAGIDLNFTKKGGITMALFQNQAKEKSMRIYFGLYWVQF